MAPVHRQVSGLVQGKRTPELVVLSSTSPPARLEVSVETSDRNLTRKVLEPFEGKVVVARGTLREARHADETDHFFMLSAVKLVLLNNEVAPATQPKISLDHAWVRVTPEVKERWKRRHPSGLLLKHYEAAYEVYRYQRRDGIEDLGLKLNDEWTEFEFIQRGLRKLVEEGTGRDPNEQYRRLDDWQQQLKHQEGGWWFAGLDSKKSLDHLFKEFSAEVTGYIYQLKYLVQREKKKKQVFNNAVADGQSTGGKPQVKRGFG